MKLFKIGMDDITDLYRKGVNLELSPGITVSATDQSSK